MKWLALLALALLITTPVFAQSFRGPDQRPFKTSTSRVNGVAVPTSATAVATNASNQFITATYQGNGAKVQLSTGATTTGDLVKYDANGNTVDAGAFQIAASASLAMSNYGGL